MGEREREREREEEDRVSEKKERERESEREREHRDSPEAQRHLKIERIQFVAMCIICHIWSGERKELHPH